MPRGFGLSLILCGIIKKRIKDAPEPVAHPFYGYLVMKRVYLYNLLLVLILLFVIILLLSIQEQATISITIVIPSKLIPYYDWLMDFPGWRNPGQIPPPYVKPVLDSYYSVTPKHNSITILQLPGNRYPLKW